MSIEIDLVLVLVVEIDLIFSVRDGTYSVGMRLF